MIATEETLFSLGGGMLLGFLAGYAFKRIVKIAAVIIGGFILVLGFLSYKGWINANWTMIENQTRDMAYNATQQVINTVNHMASKFQHTSLVSSEATPIAGSVGFLIGFGIGVTRK